MMVTARRLRSIGWMATLVVCCALVMILALRVNALRSQVHRSSARIIALKQETLYLETEFETRTNQQQLKNWNDVEFGYVPPLAAQYLDNERQLALYAKPAEPGAPAPIRVASADDAVDAAAAFPAMVSPLTGHPISEANETAGRTPAVATPATYADQSHSDGGVVESPGGAGDATLSLASLGDRLGTVRDARSQSAAQHTAKPATAKKPGPLKTKPAKTKSARSVATAKTNLHKAGVEKSAGPGSANRSARLAKRQVGKHPATADARRAGAGRRAGSPMIRLALKDAKTVK